MAKELTRRQKEILLFIVECIRDRGCPPTILEIGEVFGIASTNGVNDHLLALERKGYIERSNKARGIRVTEKAAAGLYGHNPTTIPLVGRVAAGLPVLAQENVEDQITVAPSVAERNCYCLRVRGDSMIEDAILDGDIIIVDQGLQPKAGDIVVALVEDDATVKRYYPRGSMVELRPANQSMRPMLFPAVSVTIQGVVVGLQRTLR